MRREDSGSTPVREGEGNSEDQSDGGVHLIVLIHGLYGNPSNLAVVKEELERASSLAAAESESQCSKRPSRVHTDRSSGSGSGSNRTDQCEIENDSDSDNDRATETEGEGGEREEDVDVDEVDTLLKPAPRYNGRKIMTSRILVLKSFEGSHTWDGIDINAQRAAKEIDIEISRIEDKGERVEVFSIMGYSLGGLVARYLVGLLHARSPSFFDIHRPGSFSTFATPHVGVLRYGSRVNTIVHTVGRRLFSRSGKQLYRIDHTLPFSLATTKSGMGEREHRSLLSILADPDHVFLEALALFPRIQVVANGCNDLTVPYPTGAISLTDPFVDHVHHPLDLELDEDSCIEPDHPLHPDRSLATSSSTASAGARVNSSASGSRRRSGYTKIIERPRSPHRFPPIFYLPLPWPFGYLGFIVVPFLLPIFLTYAFVTFWLHTRQSETRTRSAGERYHEEHTPLLSRPPSRARTPPNGRHVPSSLKLSSLEANDNANDLTADQESPGNAMTTNFRANRIPLLLDHEQRRMIDNLNEHLPQLERVITWWPWCFNTHAMLVVRSAKRFAYQEEGRGVVRRWAEWAIDVDVDVNVEDDPDAGRSTSTSR